MDLNSSGSGSVAVGRDNRGSITTNVTHVHMPDLREVTFPVHVIRQGVVRHFSGRDDSLSEIQAAISNSHDEVPLVALVGLGGIGKTQLAARYCHLNRAALDVIAWLRADSRTKLVKDLASLGERLGLQADPRAIDMDESLAIKTREWLEVERREWLLVLDNVENGTQFVDLLPTVGEGAILITSRSQSLGADFYTIQVEALTASDSANHLMASTESNDRQGAVALAEALGGLPLALAHASAYVRKRRTTFRDYLESLEAFPARELLNEAPTRFYHSALASTWLCSIRAAAEEAPEAEVTLHRLGFFDPDGVPRWLVEGPVPAQATGAVLHSLTLAISALSDYSLIDLTSDEVRVHRMVQKVVRDHCLGIGSAGIRISEIVSILGEALHESERQGKSNDLLALYPHIASAVHWSKSHQDTLGSDVVHEAVVLVTDGLRHAMRVVSVASIPATGPLRDPLTTLKTLRFPVPSTQLDDDASILLRNCLNETVNPDRVTRALKSIITKGDDQQIACAMLFSVLGKRNPSSRLLLATHERSRAVLRRNPGWNACLRFALHMPHDDEIARLILETAVQAGEISAVPLWIRAVGRDKKRLRRLRDRHEQITLKLAGLLMDDDEYDEAAIVMKEGLRLGPQVPASYSKCLARLGRHQEAREILQTFAEEQPLANRALSVLQKSEGEIEPAEQTLRRFAGVDLHCTMDLVQLLLERGAKQDAVELLQKCSKAWPTAALQLHRIYIANKDILAAAEVLRPHVAKNPQVKAAANKLVARTPVSSEHFAAITSLLGGISTAQQKHKSFPASAKPTKIDPQALMRAREFVQQEEWDRVVSILEPAALWKDAAKDGRLVVSAAQRLAKSGAVAASVALLEHYASRYPAVAVQLANRCLRQKQHERALEVVRRHVAAAESDEQLALQIAAVQEKAGALPDAHATLSRVAKPSAATVIRVADLLISAGATEEALSVLADILPNGAIADKIAKICTEYRLEDTGIHLLSAVKDPSPHLRSALSRLRLEASGAGTNTAVRQAEIEWHFGNATKAIRILSPVSLAAFKPASLLVEYLVASGEWEQAFSFLSENLPKISGLMMLAIELSAEYGGLSHAAPLVEPFVARDIEAAMGLSWLAFREGDTELAHTYLGRFDGSNQLQPVIGAIEALKRGQPVTRQLAVDLRGRGQYGYAEDLLRSQPRDLISMVQLAELLRTRLAFDESRHLLEGIAQKYLPAACGMCTTWIRNANLERAAEVLASYSGSHERIRGVSRFIPSVRDDPKAAAIVAKNMLDVRQIRCAYEVLQVTKNQQHSQIRSLMGVQGIAVGDAERRTIARLRRRVFARDKDVRLKVWPDYRDDDLRQEANRRKLASIREGSSRSGRS
ncbi:NB-ARC domain-containing protein [Streptomyces sp. NPDC005078]|uniref:tetratricopeptide repeat protein n=1 Tax=Streptomyces sp. NPDC005078 TaxID=3154293 RepID=UPI0033A3D797